MEVIVERCAALDVHKKTVMACGPWARTGSVADVGAVGVPDVQPGSGRAAGLAGRPRASPRWRWKRPGSIGSRCGTCSRTARSSCCW